jgi:signal transduction histidine kinase
MPDKQLIRVLVVEDDDEDFVLTRDYLSDSTRVEFKVTRARRADEALTLLKNATFDVCLVDYRLGEVTGVEFFEASKMSTPAVLLTGTGDSDLADRALQAGFSDFLEKGRIDGASLDRSIRYVLERRKQQDAILRLNHELEARVEQRTRDLMNTNKELESFCYSVSHDLRAPLRAIVSTSSILIEDYGPELAIEARELLRSQIESGVRLGTLIDDLLQFIRMRDMVPDRRDVDLTQLANDVINELQRGPVIFQVQPGMVASADPGMLRTVLQNFVDNAIKFTKAGEAPQIEIGQIPEGAFFVRDHGIGFEMRYVHKLFSPFERLHRIDEYPGNGIGLASVKRYVELHGGKVWAESVSGQGSTFYFQV